MPDRIYEAAIRKEVASWPGVSVKFEARAKHEAAVLSYDNRSRFVIIPATPSDAARGAKNAVPCVRAELTALGARRDEKPATRAKPKRRPQARPPRPIMPNIGKATPKANPFAILATIAQPIPPAKPTIWARIRALFGKGKAK